ncbi:hypothetical protein HYFRA_00006274 [Hymenoscyphus fraxineus]|uniref:Uncharacterized protein n=1 Tax=Hymenoscyphus fraxineus TaxID=746836 RepID=A0A9N9Q1G0_9HELO|nr:hypothetical protein HYFRA_00006274 [Hymenoscyphus fraxineus]
MKFYVLLQAINSVKPGPAIFFLASEPMSRGDMLREVDSCGEDLRTFWADVLMNTTGLTGKQMCRIPVLKQALDSRKDALTLVTLMSVVDAQMYIATFWIIKEC